MWTFVPSGKSSSSVVSAPINFAQVGDVKTDPGPVGSKDEAKDASLPVAMVKHNGGLLALGAKSRSRTKVRRDLAPQKGGKKKLNNSKQFEFTENDRLFSSVGFPPPYRVGFNNEPHYIMQSYEVRGFHTTSNAVNTFAAQFFTVGSLDQIVALAEIFDQYKIALIEVWITPEITTATVDTGLFHSVIDYDDATLLTTIAQANDYDNVMVANGIEGHYRRFVPHIQNALVGGGLQNMKAPWIDSASTAVPHFGLKTAATPQMATIIYDMTVRLHTIWRNIR